MVQKAAALNLAISYNDKPETAVKCWFADKIVVILVCHPHLILLLQSLEEKRHEEEAGKKIDL